MVLSNDICQEALENNVQSMLFAFYADRLLAQGNTADAFEVCSDGLEHHPDFATGWVVFGRISLAREEYEFAKTCFMRALQSDRVALQAAELLLSTEEIDLKTEESRYVARSLLNIQPGHETAQRVYEQAEQAVQAAQDEDLDAQMTVDEIEKSEIDEDEVQGGEEYKEGSDEVPGLSDSEEDDSVQKAFQDALGEEVDFTPPELDIEVEGDETGAEEDSGFKPPEFEPELLDESLEEFDAEVSDIEMEEGDEEEGGYDESADSVMELEPEETTDESGEIAIEEKSEQDEVTEKAQPEDADPDASEAADTGIEQEQTGQDLSPEEDSEPGSTAEASLGSESEAPEAPDADTSEFATREEEDTADEGEDAFNKSLARKIPHTENGGGGGERDPKRQIPFTQPFQDPSEEVEEESAEDKVYEEMDEVELDRALRKKYGLDDTEDESEERPETGVDETAAAEEPPADEAAPEPAVDPETDEDAETPFDIFNVEEEEIEQVMGAMMVDDLGAADEPLAEEGDDIDEVEIEQEKSREDLEREADELLAEISFQEEETEEVEEASSDEPAEMLADKDLFPEDDDVANEFQIDTGELEEQADFGSEDEEEPDPVEMAFEDPAEAEEEDFEEVDDEDDLGSLAADEVDEPLFEPDTDTGGDEEYEFDEAEGEAGSDEGEPGVDDEFETVITLAEEADETAESETTVPDEGEEESGEVTGGDDDEVDTGPVITAGNETENVEAGPGDTREESLGDENTGRDTVAHTPEQDRIKITSRMATFTFAEVLKSQGLYDQAYQVLELMREKTSNIERIEQEQQELQELMNRDRPGDDTAE